MTKNRVARFFLSAVNPWRLAGPIDGVQSSRASTSPREVTLNVGDQIRIISGALAGTEGTIVSRYRAGRLIIKASLLQQGVSIELDEHQVARIT